MRRILIFFLGFYFLLYSYGWGQDYCKRLSHKVKSASEFVLGLDFPWYYNLGQIEVESNCIWTTSLDGWGSIGYAQITPSFWSKTLNKLFPNWKIKDSQDHFLAQAYIIKEALKESYCKNKLWNAYQCYNRNCKKVNREAILSNCSYNLAFKICNEKFVENICVWKIGDFCKQYRTNCDINYKYSYKIYKNGRKYHDGRIEKKIGFF